jgi:hypothetical protein
VTEDFENSDYVFSLSFRAIHLEIEPESVSSFLGVVPSGSRSKGDFAGKRSGRPVRFSAPARADIWYVSSTSVWGMDIDVDFLKAWQEIWDKFDGKEDKLTELIKQGNCFELTVMISGINYFPSIIVPSHVLGILSKLGARLELDIMGRLVSDNEEEE